MMPRLRSFRVALGFLVAVVAAVLWLLPRTVAATSWSLLAHTAAHNTSSNVSVTTTAINDTGATLDVIVVVGTVAGVGFPTTLTDSASNTNYYYTPPGINSNPYGTIIAWIVNPITSSSHTWTFNNGTNTYPALAVTAWSGSFGGVELCTHVGGSGTTSTPGSITPSLANALLITGYDQSDSSTSVTYSISGGFTIADQLAGGAVAQSVGSAYLIQTSATAANPTWTKTGSSTTQSSIMCSFLNQPSGGGGGETSSIIGGGS
jgi:hypothetical protein